MQSYIDSCTSLYSQAINELKPGASKDLVKSKYINIIIAFHSKFSKDFDSVTSAYTKHEITQAENDRIKNSILLDSVSHKSDELSQLGVDIELK